MFKVICSRFIFTVKYPFLIKRNKHERILISLGRLFTYIFLNTYISKDLAVVGLHSQAKVIIDKFSV